jgi:hypothetical protein
LTVEDGEALEERVTVARVVAMEETGAALHVPKALLQPEPQYAFERPQ